MKKYNFVYLIIYEISDLKDLYSRKSKRVEVLASRGLDEVVSGQKTPAKAPGQKPPNHKPPVKKPTRTNALYDKMSPPTIILPKKFAPQTNLPTKPIR